MNWIEENRLNAAKSKQAHGSTWWRSNCQMIPIDKYDYVEEWVNEYRQKCYKYTFKQMMPLKQWQFSEELKLELAKINDLA